MAGHSRIDFYHLEKWPLDKALPRLLERALDHGLNVVVRTASEERLDALNRALWTYDPKSFLPHGGPADGNAEAQPVYLTTGTENPNRASVLVLTDGLDADDVDAFERCIDMFDGAPDAVAAARVRWAARAAAGHAPTYWQQTANGRWEKKR